MLFVIRFTDHQDRREVRQKYLDSHIEWLSENRRLVLTAGSLRSELSANPIGALWIVDAETQEEVEALYQQDPFWLNGLRKSVEVLHWSKAFPDEKALI